MDEVASPDLSECWVTLTGLGGAIQVFHLDRLRRRLFRLDALGEIELHLDPKALGVLLKLVDHAGEVVTKAYLKTAIWPEREISDDCLH
jgi:DNA-binding winged helix-turn-helix (wHTH) protein